MRIRERRKILGITQQQFAKLLGVTYQQIHKYEYGKNSLSAGQLYELASRSGTPVEYFFEGLEKNERQLLPCHNMLLDVMCSLEAMKNKNHQRAIGQLVRSLAG